MHAIEPPEVGIVSAESKTLTSTGKFVLGVVMFMIICFAVVIIDLMSTSSSAVLPNDTMGKCQVSYVSTDVLPAADNGSGDEFADDVVRKNVYSIVMPDGQEVEGYGVHGAYIPLDGEYGFTGVLRSDGGYNITVDSSYIPISSEEIHEASRGDWDPDAPNVSQVISDFTWVPAEGYFATDDGDTTVDGADDEAGEEALPAEEAEERDVTDMTLDEKLAIVAPAPSNSMKVDGYAVDSVTGTHEGCAQPETAIDVIVSYKNLFANHPVTMIAVLTDASTGNVIRNEDGIEVIAARDFVTSAHENTIPTAADDKLIDDFCAMVSSVIREAPASAASLPSEDEVSTVMNGAKQGGAAKLIEEKGALEAVYRYAHGCELPISESLPALQQIADACERVHVAGAYANLGDGQLAMSIPVEGSVLKGKTIAIQLELSSSGNMIVQLPLDLSDTNYRISYPSIETEATIRGVHEAKAEPGTVIIDTVTYANLTPGVQYHVESTVTDMASHATVLDQVTNEKVAYITEFVPEKSEGVFNVIFPEFDSTSMRGRTALVKEEIYRCETNVTEKNADDGEIAAPVNENVAPTAILHSSQKATLVATIEDAENPLASIEFNKDVSLAETGVQPALMALSQTGDEMRFMVIAAIAVMSVIAMIAIRIRRK